MTGLEANILVRYLAQDDPAQSQRATEIIERFFWLLRCGFTHRAQKIKLPIER